jgi:hypothetical protein
VKTRYSYEQTLERVRAACSRFSTIDVDQQARHVVDEVMKQREHARAEVVAHELRRAGRR